jgi:hypothetical protein
MSPIHTIPPTSSPRPCASAQNELQGREGSAESVNGLRSAAINTNACRCLRG